MEPITDHCQQKYYDLTKSRFKNLNKKEVWVLAYMLGMYHKGQVLGEYLSDVPFCNFDGKKILEDTANHQYKNYLESGRFILKDLHSDQQDVLDPYHIEGPLAWDNKLSECQMNADKWRHKYEELYHYYKTNVQQVFRVKQDD